MAFNHLAYFSEDVRRLFVRTDVEPYFEAIAKHLEDNFQYSRLCRIERNSEYKINLNTTRYNSSGYFSIMSNTAFSDINFNDITIDNYFKMALKVGLITFERMSLDIQNSLHYYACFLTYCLIEEIRNQLPNNNHIPWNSTR